MSEQQNAPKNEMDFLESVIDTYPHASHSTFRTFSKFSTSLEGYSND